MVFIKSKYLLAICCLLSSMKMVAMEEMPKIKKPIIGVPDMNEFTRECVRMRRERVRREAGIAVELLLAALIKYEKGLSANYEEVATVLNEELREAMGLMHSAFSSRKFAHVAVDGAQSSLTNIKHSFVAILDPLDLTSQLQLYMMYTLMVMIFNQAKEKITSCNATLDQLMQDAYKESAEEFFASSSYNSIFKDKIECQSHIQNVFWNTWHETPVIRHYLEIFAWLVLECPFIPPQKKTEYKLPISGGTVDILKKYA